MILLKIVTKRYANVQRIIFNKISVCKILENYKNRSKNATVIPVEKYFSTEVFTTFQYIGHWTIENCLVTNTIKLEIITSIGTLLTHDSESIFLTLTK